MTLEPVSRGEKDNWPRTASAQLTDRARRMVDNALDRVFNEPFEIHSEDDFERVMTEHRATMSFASAGALAGFVERALPLAKLSTKAGKKVPMPAIKYTLAAIPIAMQLGNSVRHGVREVQVLASYLIHRLREAGIEPRRGLVTALALSISLDPERRPDLGLTPARRCRARAPLDHALDAHGVGQVGRPSRPLRGGGGRSPRPASSVEGMGSPPGLAAPAPVAPLRRLPEVPARYRYTSPFHSGST